MGLGNHDNNGTQVREMQGGIPNGYSIETTRVFGSGTATKETGRKRRWMADVPSTEGARTGDTVGDLYGRLGGWNVGMGRSNLR